VIVVLGPGGFGGAVARALLARGRRVRVLSRRGEGPAGAESVAGDAADLSTVMDAAQGAEAIVQAVDVPFARWDSTLVRVNANAVAAAQATGARLVFPASLDGAKPIYDVPLPPNVPRFDYNDVPTRRGELRNLLEDQVRQLVEEHGGRALVIRCHDLFGPGCTSGPAAESVAAVVAGRPVPWPGAGERVFTFADDAGAVVAALLARDDLRDLAYCAVGGHRVDAEAWAGRVARAVGVRAPRVRRIRRAELRVRGLWDAEARARAELYRQWEGCLVLDDSEARALTGLEPTPLDEALARTVAWWRRG
jgi:nucleoside-diphosphate-sugar epimerase